VLIADQICQRTALASLDRLALVRAAALLGVSERVPHSFTRLFALIRSVVWDRFHLPALLEFNATAGARSRMRAQPEQGFLPGFAPMAVGQQAV